MEVIRRLSCCRIFKLPANRQSLPCTKSGARRCRRPQRQGARRSLLAHKLMMKRAAFMGRRAQLCDEESAQPQTVSSCQNNRHLSLLQVEKMPQCSSELSESEWRTTLLSSRMPVLADCRERTLWRGMSWQGRGRNRILHSAPRSPRARSSCHRRATPHRCLRPRPWP